MGQSFSNAKDMMVTNLLGGSRILEEPAQRFDIRVGAGVCPRRQERQPWLQRYEFEMGNTNGDLEFTSTL